VQSNVLAKALGIRRVVVPRNPGGFCALGEIRANILHNAVRTYAIWADDIDWDRLSMLYKEMEASLIDTLLSEGIPPERILLKRFIDARYIGQVYEVETPVASVDKLGPEYLPEIRERFESSHEALYHFRMGEEFDIEFVSCRVEAAGEVPVITLAELPFDGIDPSGALKGKRKVYVPENGGFEEVNIYDGEKLKHGNVLNGVALIETEGSTLGLWKNERLVVNKYGDFEIEIGGS
jgi:N-methylhydantoinase A